MSFENFQIRVKYIHIDLKYFFRIFNILIDLKYFISI